MKFKNAIIITSFILFILMINTASATSDINDDLSPNITDKSIPHTTTQEIENTNNINTDITNQTYDTKKRNNLQKLTKTQESQVKTENKEIYVNKSSESTIEDGTKINPYKIINETLINGLENDTTINIANGKYKLDTINLKNNIQIIGQNKTETILYTDSTNGLFNIANNANLKLVNLTIRDYTSTISATINNNGQLTIENVFFQNITRDIETAKGGAIYNTNNLNLLNCIFDNNKASYGACIYNNKAKTVIINTTFTNSEILNVGGAIYSINSKTEVYDSKFMYNKAVSGAAIYNAFGNLTVNHSYFFENNARDFFGGAIYNTGQTITNNSKFIENHATIDGGAITNTCYFYSINCSYISNWASKNGGAIENIPVNENETGNIVLINNTFSENSADKGGALINYNRESLNGIINIINTIFIENSADEGGVIYNERTLNITNSTFEENEANIGSAIWTEKAESLSFNKTKFINNEENNNPIYANEGNVDKTKFKFLNETSFEITDVKEFKIIQDPEIKIETIPNFEENQEVTIKITANKKFNDKLNITINGVNYSITIINGLGTTTINPNLKAGPYKAIINYIGNNNYFSKNLESNIFIVTAKAITPTNPTTTTINPTKKKIYSVKIYLTLKQIKKISKNFKKLFLNIIIKHNGKKTKKSITFKVKNNKIKTKQGHKFTIKIKNKTYTVKTDKKGKTNYKITNINKKGTYTAKIKYSNVKSYKNIANIKFKVNY